MFNFISQQVSIANALGVALFIFKEFFPSYDGQYEISL